MKASSQPQSNDTSDSKNKKNLPIAGHSNGDRMNRSTPRLMLPALLALGGGYGVVADNAAALELGDITVQSTLGQPLRASIAYALGPNEDIQNHCIYLRPASSSRGLPGIRNATVNVTNGAIRLSGRTAIRDPLLTLQLMVDCPGSANLSREYAVFIDPSSRLQAAPSAATSEPAVRSVDAVTRQSVAPATQRVARPSTTFAAPIAGQSRYSVQPGDTLSGIAARIGDRDISLWQAVDVIFAANPDAFINNDRNLLRAGSVLVLPDMGQVAARNTASIATGQGDRSAESSTSSQSSVVTRAAEPSESPAATVDAGSRTADRDGAAGASIPVADTSASAPRVGDVAMDSESPFVTPVDPDARAGGDARPFGPAQETIADTRIDPAVTPRIVVGADTAATSDGWGWLAWLGGSGVAIILGLLLFGRQLKERFSPHGRRLAHAQNPERRRTDIGDTRRMPAPQNLGITVDEFTPHARPVTLDADLETGSGFDDEIDVAQEFGFSTSRDLYGSADMELSEFAASEPEQHPTDIMPPQRFSDTLILEKEIPPSDDTGEYDMSMIVDATRQSIGEMEDTTKDLRAVQVDTGDNEPLDADDDTLSKVVEYKILEQDYEAELTATQALNAEILKAAKAAAASMDGDNDSEAPTAEYIELGEELTAQLPESFDGEPTSEMPISQDAVAEELADVVELDDSGINEEITGEMPAADNDSTVDIEIESATVDTKKLRAS